jgi:hypothetical protein
VERITIGLTAELDGEQCTALAVTPGWLRSEAMLDEFGVTEQNWRDGTARSPHFCISESPAYVARGIAALSADPDVARYAGTSLTSAQLARIYDVTDTDRSRPDSGPTSPRSRLRDCQPGRPATADRNHASTDDRALAQRGTGDSPAVSPTAIRWRGRRAWRGHGRLVAKCGAMTPEGPGQVTSAGAARCAPPRGSRGGPPDRR